MGALYGGPALVGPAGIWWGWLAFAGAARPTGALHGLDLSVWTAWLGQPSPELPNKKQNQMPKQNPRRGKPAKTNGFQSVFFLSRVSVFFSSLDCLLQSKRFVGPLFLCLVFVFIFVDIFVNIFVGIFVEIFVEAKW